ncbi:MAG: type II toxin-antitoxin system RelE/ParE family toxin [Desulfobacterales bacterium]|nr:type II toxin-antitoxin system RelE/ParE family toxin [Desulfobacterales bacterium]
MARSVKWTEVAWSDLEEVADYIANESRHYAAAFVREVRDAARSLAYFSERGFFPSHPTIPVQRKDQSQNSTVKPGTRSKSRLQR